MSDIDLSSNTPITDQTQQNVNATVGSPAGQVPQGQGPIDPNGPPMAPPGSPGVQQNPVAVPRAVAQQQAQQQAAQQDLVSHAALGHGVKALFHSLNNTESKYVVDANGQISQQTVPAKPGAFFRNLIGGMLLGAAAGSDKPAGTGGGNFVGGFGRGVSAQQQNQKSQDDQQYKRAQDQATNQREQQRQLDENQLHAAQVAHLNQEVVGMQDNLHHADQQMIDQRNASARTYEKSLIDSGAQPFKFTDANGEKVDSISASALAKAYTADPTIAHAPDGYERHLIDLTDATGLTFNGTQWTDDSGHEVNMSDKTQIKAYDVPTSSMKSYSPTSGTVINKLAGDQIVDAKGTYSISGEGKLAIRSLGLKNDATEARALAAKARAAKQADMTTKANQINDKWDVAAQKVTDRYNSIIDNPLNDGDEARKTKAAEQRDADLRTIEGSRKRDLTKLGPQAQTNTPRVTVGQHVTLKSGNQVEITKVNPNGTFEYK